DISQILADTFKNTYTRDIIGKDTLSNLDQTKTGQSSYREEHAEELRRDYQRRVAEADMLESSITQALAQAAAKEGRAYKELTENVGDFSDHPGLFTKSAFWCPDEDLLRRNNLISPRDYLPTQKPADERAPVFQAKPQVIIFSDYAVGQVYESTLELTNVTNASCHVRVVPPATPYFSIGLRFPGDGGVVAPGLSCRYTLRFTPDSLGNYEDFVVVESPAAPQLLVPVEAWRPPPILTPRVLDCGNCLVGGVKFVEFRCQNVGLSSGSFYVAPKDQWPNSNLRSVSRTYFSEQPPFAVGPSLLVLQPGEVAAVEQVVFFPTAAEKSRRLFTVVCDNCQVKDISIELTAGHFVRFGPCSPHSVQRKTLVVRNNHLELPFYWQIMKPNLHPVLPGEAPESSHIHFHPAADDVFHISPASGVLGPGQDHEFHLTFSPKELEDYHSVCHLVLIDVVVTMEIEVKGSTEPYHILLEPYAVVIPGEISMGAAIRRPFKMWNHSKQFASFQWEKLENSCYTMEVEPSAGRIENECFDFDLILTGRKPEKVETALICNIQHHHQPVILPVEVSFKGPTVTVSVPSVDFGLVRFGNQARTSLLLTNTTQLESFWTLEEKLHQPQDHRDTQRGALPPLASCDVELVFRPRFCQQLETELELTVEDGTGHVWVRADVQSPRVCFLNSELVLSELYFGVPAKGSVTLFNQTLLPSRFSWFVRSLLADGKGAAFRVLPESGLLGPFETLTVDVTAYNDMWGEYTDHLVCKVGELEPVGVLMMMTVKGCPLYFQMTGPAADDQFQGPVIDIRMDWETYNTDQNDRKLVDVLVSYGEHFPLKDADGNELLGGAPGLFGETMRERRRTPPSDGTSDVAKREFVTEDEREEREESCLCRPPAKKNLISVHIRPHLGDLSDSPYCVTPRQTVIPAKSSGNVRVSFTPLTLSPSDGVSTCAGLALGFMSLDSETAVCIPGKVRRARGLDLEPVRVDLQAAVQPVLLVQMDEYDGVLEFNASAGDLLRAESDEERSVRLMNATETPLRFRLETQPPFSVLKPTVPLSAYLDLPALSLSADSLSFGFCYVGQTQTREIDLHSHGAHTYWKALTEGDPRVFRVTPDSGLLRPEKPPGVTCSQRLQVSFTP
uniref:DLEC1 cilia and flagella associated protein n=1 Tax=Kryptolebias marmoratus TaxID=37003 RepID=A0A3Q3AEI5_KRYMA